MSRTPRADTAAMLAAKLNTRRAERAQILEECKTEKAAAAAKIEALQIEHDSAATPEEYKRTANEMQEQREYKTFLEKRSKEVNASPLITLEEYKEIEKAIKDENSRLIDANAAQILKKYEELLELLETYAGAADELQAVLVDAEKAHFKRALGGHLWHDLEELRADNNSFFGKLCRAFFDFYKSKAGGRP